MDFVLPQTNADMLPFVAACVTIVFGLVALFAPRIMLRILKLETTQRHPDAMFGSRATIAGFWIGTGLVTAALYSLVFVQWTLGAGWLFTAFGRLVSLLSDRGTPSYNWLLLLIDLALAFAALGPSLGLVSS